jgi:hypothetical protein
LHHDTADVVIVKSDVDIALVTPGSSPGVSDHHIVYTILGTIADCSDCMIQGLAAISGVDDSTSVLLEYDISSFNSDTNWLNVKLRLELRDTSWCNCSIVGKLDQSIGFNGSVALTILGLIWIEFFECNFVISGIVEGWSIITSIATIGTIHFATINKLLL